MIPEIVFLHNASFCYPIQTRYCDRWSVI